MRPFAIFVVLAALAPLALAQRGGGTARATAPHFRSPANNFSRSRSSHPAGYHRSPYAAYGSLPFPFFGDSFDPDDIYSTGYPVASEPPPYLMQAMRAMAGPGAGAKGPAIGALNDREPSSSQPLMIELQNGRYVRVNNAAVDGEALPLNFSDNSASTKSPHIHSVATSDSAQPNPIAAAAPDLPPAVLVFRDGHSEEVRDYAIADGILYARGNYYSDGYWNKKINLTALNVSQTLEANATRNVKFVLPSSPNEVITRP